MSPQIAPLTLFFASIFTSNILLANFLGMCSFISISKDFTSSNGLGLAVTVVLTLTGMINWAVLHYILYPLGLYYLRFIVFIVVIAAVVQILEMVIDRLSPALYMTLGIFLPLITVNCAIMGVALFIEIRKYSFIQATVFSLARSISASVGRVATAVNSGFANVARQRCACHRQKRVIPKNLGQLALRNQPSSPLCACLRRPKRVPYLCSCGWISYPPSWSQCSSVARVKSLGVW